MGTNHQWIGLDDVHFGLQQGGANLEQWIGTLGKLQADEISESRLVPLSEALRLLRGPIRRRVREATRGRALVYLEDGRPV